MKWKFWEKERIIPTIYVGEDNIDEVEAAFRHDPEFIDALQSAVDKVATKLDRRCLDNKMKEGGDAPEWWDAMQTMTEHADLKIKKPMPTRGYLVLIVLLFGIGCYALSYIPRKPAVAKQAEHGFYQWKIRSVLDSAQRLYNRKIILDHPEIGDAPCSGTLDPAMSCKDFLENFTLINGLEFYSDAEGVLHVRRPQTAGMGGE